MKLFNFDHGLTSATTFTVGPFTITITDEHIANLGKLPQREKQHYGSDAFHQPLVTQTPQSPGEFLETACAHLNGAPQPSRLFPKSAADNCVWDLILLLSFITGRRVYEESNLEWDPHRNYVDRMIPPHDVPVLTNYFWSKLTELATQKLSDALNCIVNAPLAPEAIGWGMYASAAQDATVTSWTSRNRQSKYPDAEKLLALQADIAEFLAKHEMSQETIADFTVRINGSLGQPSALLKLQWFLKAMGVYPDNPTPEQVTRLKALNTVRNAVVHSGAVRVDKVPVDAMDRIAIAVILVMQDIVEFYLMRHAFDIKDGLTVPMHLRLRGFFFDGKLGGQRVFEEDYASYIARAEQTWMTDFRLEM